MICDSKQLKKLAAIRSSLTTIRHVIYFDDEDSPSGSRVNDDSSSWKVSSFVEVEKLGQTNPVQPNLPIKKDIAVIMYTSGSTGLPKVLICIICLFLDMHIKLPIAWCMNIVIFIFGGDQESCLQILSSVDSAVIYEQ